VIITTVRTTSDKSEAWAKSPPPDAPLKFDYHQLPTFAHTVPDRLIWTHRGERNQAQVCSDAVQSHSFMLSYPYREPMYSTFHRRSFLVAAVAILGWALFAVLQPLCTPLGWAVVLAFLLQPLHDRLTAKLKGHRSAAAGILTAATPLFVITPFIFIAIAFTRQVVSLVNTLRGRSFLSLPELLDRVAAYPVIGPAARWLRDSALVSAEQIEGWIASGVQTTLKSAAAMSSTVALGLVGSLVGFFMMLFMLFFLLRDGRSALEYLTRLIPMESASKAKLLVYLGDVTRAVAFGSTATALIQGTCVGLGFAIAGLPSPVVFGAIGAFAALLPVGSAAVLVPAVLYLAFSGRWGATIFLAVWSVAVGLVDNFLRPFLASQRAEVSTLVVFIGAIGGVSTFGVLGLIVGPVLLSFTVALLRFAASQATKEDIVSSSRGGRL
jgi:predicted PurR-regulated permease PerM